MTKSTPESMGAAWRRMCGVALLWASMAALVHVATADRAGYTTIVALGGFLCFALGLNWFAESMKRDLLDRLQRNTPGNVISLLLAGGLLMASIVPACAADSTAADAAHESKSTSEAPSKVTEALKAHFPGAEIEKWSQETEDSVVIYDFEFRQKGRKLEADLRADGSIHNWEESMAAKDLPDAVRAAVEAKYPKAEWRAVMRINTVHAGKDVLEGYEVLLVTADSADVEVTVAPSGKILEDKPGDE